MSHEQQIYVYESDKKLLDELRRRPEIRQLAADRGVVTDDENGPLSYNKLLLSIIPEEAPKLNFDEGERERLYVRDDGKERVDSVVGRGVDRRTAILHYAAEALQEADGQLPEWILNIRVDDADIDELSDN